MVVIDCKNIDKVFSDKKVLSNVSFSIQKGECVALLGQNGAGKTTLLNIILDKILPTKGQVTNTYNRFNSGYLTQGTKFPNDVRVNEVLKFVASFSKNPLTPKEIDKILQFSDAQMKQFAGKLSGGQKRLLDFCLTILNRPQFLIVDEPTGGMDTTSRKHFWEIMEHLKKEGTTILFTTHYIEEVNYCADRVILLKEGKLIADDTPFHLRSLDRRKSMTFEKDMYELEKNQLASLKKEFPIKEEVKENTVVWHFPSQQVDSILASLLDKKINLSSVELNNSSLLEAVFADEFTPKKGEV